MHNFTRSKYLLVLFTVASLAISQFGFAQTTSPKVNFFYLIPSDSSYNQAYEDGIKKAALSIQSFYSEQLGGSVYATTNPTVDVIYSANDTAWHADQMWSRSIDTVGATFNDPNNIYIIYVDALASCTPNNPIGGTSGIAVLAKNDLHGLAGEPIEADCNGNFDLQDESRWFGGLGHELGHALGLPHPAGCDAGLSSCDSDSIMWLGFRDYPNTYLGSAALDILDNSGFFTSTYENPRTLPHIENFENGVTWNNTGEINWALQSGPTPSSQTGPSQGAQRASSNYVYFETSSPSANIAGDQAILESDVFAAHNSYITFKYHMYGSDIGTLAIEVSKNGMDWDTVWSKTGQQNTSESADWKAQMVRLDSFSGNIRLRVKATAIGGDHGAIDNLKINKKQ
ncbi:MAG: hypothetical protein ACI93R_002471 [Flavobacteriales bacterium]|jgi:hypothetical protein